jgi:hypothetical protein
MVPLSGGAAIPLLDPVLPPVPELPLVPMFDPVLTPLPELPDIPELPTKLPLLGPVVAVPLEPAPELLPPDPELLPDGALPVPIGAGPASSVPGIDSLATFEFPSLGGTTVPCGSVVPPQPTARTGMTAKRIVAQQVEVSRIGSLPSSVKLPLEGAARELKAGKIKHF